MIEKKRKSKKNSLEKTEIENKSEIKKKTKSEIKDNENIEYNEKIKDKNPETKQKKQADHDKQLKIILLVLAGVLIFLMISVYISNISNNFKYAGFKFQKESVGNIDYYTTTIRTQISSKDFLEYPLDLRNDPRKLRNIEIQGKIQIKPKEKVYVAVDEDVISCEDATIGLINLGMFFGGIGLDAQSSSINKDFALENNISLVNCSSNGTVIILKSSDINKIKEISEFCYEIEYKDCEIIKVLERFELGVIAHSYDKEI